MLQEKYILKRQLGEGQTSKVYLANVLGDEQKRVAVKVMKKEYLAGGEAARR